MSSRTQQVGTLLFTVFGFALLLLVTGAQPAAAQGEGPYLAWVVDEWDGEVMTARSPQAGEGYAAVDGEKVILLVVAVGAPTGSVAGRSEAAEGEVDEAVDEWDGEVMTARVGSAETCTLLVGGVERRLRVVQAMGLKGLEPRKARRPQQ
jgi:hypothetical protein